MKRTHLILGILLTLSGIVAAQTSAPNTTQPADPQAEIARLRAENAALKSQIEELQQRLSAASAPATPPLSLADCFRRKADDHISLSYIYENQIKTNNIPQRS